jgi:hypothetical protein
MNNTLKLYLLGVAILSLSSLAGQAQTTFDFSYTYADGFIASGTLLGTQNGEYVTGISDVTVDFNGTPMTGNVYEEKWSDQTGHSPAVVSFDLNLCDILFNNFQVNGANSQSEFFLITPGDVEVYLNGGAQDIYDDSPLQSSWSLVAVPEPATLAWSGLGGLLAIGGLIRRK